MFKQLTVIDVEAYELSTIQLVNIGMFKKNQSPPPFFSFFESQLWNKI